jgi:hypothetical protein
MKNQKKEVIERNEPSRNETFTLSSDAFKPESLEHSNDQSDYEYHGPAIFKSDFCRKYLPDLSIASASRIFRNWMRNTPELMEELKATNYNKCSHFFTPKQVNICIKHFGRP